MNLTHSLTYGGKEYLIHVFLYWFNQCSNKGGSKGELQCTYYSTSGNVLCLYSVLLAYKTNHFILIYLQFIVGVCIGFT